MKLSGDPHELAVFVKGSGKPVVLLHGQISTHNYMQEVADLVSAKRRTYAPDLLGFGSSPQPKKASYSVNQHIQSLHQTILAQDISQPFVLVGHSMGATLALVYASRYPDQVKALVLTSLPLFSVGANRYSELAQLDQKYSWILKGWRAWLLCHAHQVSPSIMGIISAKALKKTYAPQLAKDALAHNWQSFRRSMDNVVIGVDPIKYISSTSVPIHFYFGSNDPISKNSHLKLKKSLAKKHRVTVLNGSHQVPLEHPKVIANAVVSL